MYRIYSYIHQHSITSPPFLPPSHRWACDTTRCAAPDVPYDALPVSARAVLDELYRLLHAHQAVVTHAAVVEAQVDCATDKTWPNE